MKLNRFLLALIVLIGTIVTCQAAEKTGLKTKFWFPDNPTLEFSTGKLIRAVIGTRNVGQKVVSLNGGMANLAFVHAPDANIYNFTSSPFRMPEFSAGEEQIVELPMQFPVDLPPRDFQLQVRLIAEESGTYVPYLVFNQTVTVLEASKFIDTELLGLYAILIALLAAAVYGGHTVAQNQGWVKKSKKTKAKTASTGGNDKSEWLKGTVADKAKKGKNI